ncbi:MAG: DEAD/DEAH box helicase [Desulfocapsa sp.]|nr:DEAD/DEAH box helicase [Desulfocapsa sp.]MBU3946429.1 DEAD/DEAH box helicase family protein [Pseudomonadota bacterium]MCG2743382.1 DEAD/DEAH box helicase family protein [Desulfobacteraceae bacterium]
MLRELELLPVYDSEQYDLIRDLQVPLLCEAKDYLRGVGFFTSGWLRLAAQGMATLMTKSGSARIVVSPILEQADWDALQFGESAKNDSVLREVLSRNIDDLELTMEKDTRNALAWMVADGHLEFRFALPRNRASAGDYHDKVGIFTDGDGDQVAIHGSLNDSVKASLNGEAFSVFKSWEPGQIPYVKMHRTRLEALWNNHNKQFKVYRIPDAIREKFIQLRISSGPPYIRPIVQQISASLHCPFDLHEYQKTAIEEWHKSGCLGVLEMATGTGKTITSLAAAVSAYQDHGRLAVIILVPYLHLLDQWAQTCRQFGFDPILCSGQHGRWQIEVKSAIQDFNIGVKKYICVLAAHKTAAMDRFAVAIRRIPAKDTLLIGDEAHGLGASHLRKALTDNATLRLGLSATPKRWFDDEGTNTIFRYFGPTCFEYSLDEAIGQFLTPYEYFPQLVSLSGDEVELYRELTQKIVTIAAQAEHNYEFRERLKKLLLQRSRIISSAQQKLPALLHLLRRMQEKSRQQGEEPNGILVYCAPGKHKEVLQAVAALGLRCHEFVHEVSLSEREKLLSQFGEGEIQVLVAIKCLDEGVDVPSTKSAFILASSTNPREFVQRRGRILRKSKGKDRAFVYDFLVVPPHERLALKLQTDVAILQREMPRFAEFASSAMNQFSARSVVRDILDHFEMLNLLDEKPWDVYHTMKKQWDWSDLDE